MKMKDRFPLGYSQIRKPVRYNPGGIFIEDSAGEILLNVRGWGRIQKLENPETVQDQIGEYIAALINTD